MQFQVEYSDEHLICLAEIIAAQYVQVIGETSCRVEICHNLPNLIGVIGFASELEDMLRESLRHLLREPLRNQSFRRQFVEHFSTHPMP